jgi:hypothetical protein
MDPGFLRMSKRFQYGVILDMTCTMQDKLHCEVICVGTELGPSLIREFCIGSKNTLLERTLAFGLSRNVLEAKTLQPEE